MSYDIKLDTNLDIIINAQGDISTIGTKEDLINNLDSIKQDLDKYVITHEDIILSLANIDPLNVDETITDHLQRIFINYRDINDIYIRFIDISNYILEFSI